VGKVREPRDLSHPFNIFKSPVLHLQALFEDITIQPQFAHFFLSFMTGKYR